MRNIAKLALACACVAVPSVAHAAGGDSGGFGISLTIPEVCQIDASAIVHDGSGLTSASVFEMCNSSHGFRVFASHRSLEEGEQVQISYDGQVKQLDASGLSEVAQRGGPTVSQVAVTIQSAGLVQGLAISLGLAVI